MEYILLSHKKIIVLWVLLLTTLIFSMTNDLRISVECLQDCNFLTSSSLHKSSVYDRVLPRIQLPSSFLLLLPLDSILCDSFLFNSPPTPHSPQILVLAEYTVSLVILHITGPLSPYHNCCFFWTYSSLLILSIGLLPEQTPELHHLVPCFGSFF